MIQLYDYQKVDELISTQYGVISYLKWLNFEKVRIEKDPVRRVGVNVKMVGEFKVAGMSVNEVEGCECETCQELYPTKNKREKVGKLKLVRQENEQY